MFKATTKTSEPIHPRGWIPPRQQLVRPTTDPNYTYFRAQKHKLPGTSHSWDQPPTVPLLKSQKVTILLLCFKFPKQRQNFLTFHRVECKCGTAEVTLFPSRSMLKTSGSVTLPWNGTNRAGTLSMKLMMNWTKVIKLCFFAQLMVNYIMVTNG